MKYKIRVGAPKIVEKDIQQVLKALRENRLSSGKYTENFEKNFAKYIQVKYAVGVNSGTSALLLMLAATNIGKGDEVITTSFTYAATTNVIILQGAKPVFVDIDQDSYNLDPSKILKKVTKKTKAIMPIHYGGQSSNMSEIMKIARECNLLVFEDAAPAVGALHKGKKVGGIGDAGGFSFFPDKNMTTGEGGMLTTNSEEIATKAKIMSRNGASSRYYHIEIGWNFKLPDPNSALGISQLKRLPKTLKERSKLASNYNELFLENLEGKIIIPKIDKGNTHTFNLYNIRFNSSKDRDYVKAFLEKNKIETRICFPPVHLQPVYSKLVKVPKNSLKITEECARTSLCMPMFPDLTEKNQKEIVLLVKKALRNHE